MSVDDREKFFAALDESLDSGTFIKLTLARYRGAEAGLKNVYVRPAELKAGRRLSFLYRYRTRDAVKNHTYAEGSKLLREMLGAEFSSGHLFTPNEDLRLEVSRKGEARLTSHPPTLSVPSAAGHERRKRRAIDPGTSVYLRELGVTNERGEVRPAMGDKLRQINKFVEIVAGLYDSSPLRGREELSVVDVGSGKGYLTFALYDYLNNVRGARGSGGSNSARASSTTSRCRRRTSSSRSTRATRRPTTPSTRGSRPGPRSSSPRPAATRRSGRRSSSPNSSAACCATATCSSARPSRSPTRCARSCWSRPATASRSSSSSRPSTRARTR